MLQVKNLSIYHKKDTRLLLKDFSVAFNTGDKVALIGEEGNGKSTLLKWIYDRDLVDSYTESEGNLISSGEKLCYLPQEFPENEKKSTIYEFMSLAGEGDFSSHEGIVGIMRDTGIDFDFLYSSQEMGTLSGGEKIKISMLRLLVQNPTVLLLDEPSNDLDIETLKWLEKVINSFEGIVIYISHDEMLIENTANKIILMEQLIRKTEPRYTVYSMTYPEFVKTRSDLFNRQLSIAENERREFRDKMERFRKIQEKVNRDLNNISRQNPSGGRLLKKKMKTLKAQERRFHKEEENLTEIPEQEEAIFFRFNDDAYIPNGKIVLELDMDKLVIEDRVLSENISLRIAGPEKVSIIGKNGVGKSTFLKIIADNLLSRKDLKVSYMPQNYEDVMSYSLTPIEYLSKVGDKDEVTMIRTYLGSMKYTSDEMLHPISELSGGQKAKLLLLKMNLEKSDVLIFDEPTRNFSPLSGGVIRDLLRSFRGCIISVSHDRKYISEVSDKIYELTEDGLEIVTEFS